MTAALRAEIDLWETSDEWQTTGRGLFFRRVRLELPPMFLCAGLPLSTYGGPSLRLPADWKRFGYISYWARFDGPEEEWFPVEWSCTRLAFEHAGFHQSVAVMAHESQSDAMYEMAVSLAQRCPQCKRLREAANGSG